LVVTGGEQHEADDPNGEGERDQREHLTDPRGVYETFMLLVFLTLTTTRSSS
jgi:hypothetical protein